MTHEETTKRIQELVPSVMELEFGCVVETNIFPSYPCHFRLCYKTWKSDILVCENNDGQEVLLSMNDCTILGKPITLAVVLRALDESKNRSFVYCIEIKKWVETESNNAVKLFYIIATSWNLSKDNFNDQTEETKTFIGGLLGIKYT